MDKEKEALQDLNLQEEFPPVSTRQWEETIQSDLKGADYEKTLVWKTYDGLSVRPYYRREDMKELRHHRDNLPGEFPYLRGYKPVDNLWDVRQDLVTGDPAAANALARQASARGAIALGFLAQFTQDTVKGTGIKNPSDMKTLLEGIDPAKVSLHFAWGLQSPLALALLHQAATDLGWNPESVRGSLDYDPLSELAAEGHYPGSFENLMEEAADALKFAASKMPSLRPLTVQSATYSFAGASLAQELAFVLAAAVEYLDKLPREGLSLEQVAGGLGFSFWTGGGFFAEIAKLRAFRLLWASVGKEMGLTEAMLKRPVHCQTTLWNKTLYDVNVNMLRNSIEAMSAVLGGCDSLSVLPHNFFFQEPDEFSYRLARNTQLVLKHEAALDRVADPAGGSYYVEQLTDKLADAAWKLFLEIEKQGGFSKALSEGWIQKQVQEVRERKQKNLSLRRDVLLGTNQYPDRKETISSRIKGLPATKLKSGSKPDIKEPFSLEALAKAFAAGAGIKEILRLRMAGAPEKDVPEGAKTRFLSSLRLQALTQARAAQPFEQLRLATEAHASKTGRTIKVLLWSQGNLGMRKARAGFAGNFFACAGYAIEERDFADVQEGVKAAEKIKPDVVVYCGADDEYPDWVPKAVASLKSSLSEALHIMAGLPKDGGEAMKQAGVQEFVHIRCDALEFLRSCQKQLGVMA